MRRIMADRITDASMIVVRPDEDQKTLRITEPNTANVGPTGFFGISEYVRSQQSLEAEVIKSGDFTPAADQKLYCGQFSLLPEFLYDENGDEVCDEYNKMGAEMAYVPCRAQRIVIWHPLYETTSVKMKKLYHQQSHDPDYGVEGIMVYAQRDGSNNVEIHTARMLVYQDFAGVASNELSYEWDTNSSYDLTPDISASAQPVACDICELPDGSLVLAFTSDDAVLSSQIHIYKSYNGGQEWSLVSKTTGLTRDAYKLALNRIGNRLVLVYGLNDGANHAIYSVTSDDGGNTWSVANTVDSSAATDEPFMDLVQGQDSRLWLVYNIASVAYVRSTSDGANWSSSTSTGMASEGGVSIAQSYHGDWWCGFVNDDSNAYFEPYVALRKNIEPGAFSTGVAFGQMASDADVDTQEICVRYFHDSAFMDSACLYFEANGGFYSIVAVRSAMWTGLQFADPSIFSWDVCWYPHAYPSAADPDPDLNVWTRVLAATATSTLAADNNFIHLELATPNGGDNMNYHIALSGDSYTNGFVAKFEAKGESGTFNVAAIMSTAAASETRFAIFFSQTQVILYDLVAGSALQTVTPTNWNPSTWNEYLLVAKDVRVQLYRAPSGTYREIAHYEKVLDTNDSSDLTTQATTIGDQFYWGIQTGLAGGAYDVFPSESHWRMVLLRDDNDIDMIDWDFDADLIGRVCDTNAVGIMQGFGCRWEGSFVVTGDSWDLWTGAQYQADNIFVHSPSIRWQEPIVATGASPAAVFQWRRPQDLDGEDMNFVFNSFAVFGRNWLLCTLEGGNYIGTIWTTLFNATAGADVGMEKPWIRKHDVSAVAQNRVTLAIGNYDDMIPNEYASNAYRKWYIYVVDGSLAGRTYRILGNTAQALYMEKDLETLGLAAPDEFVIFSDRFFYQFSATQEYERLRLTITSQRTSPSEKQLRLGTVVCGMVYDLDDDRWESRYQTVPNLAINRSRSGIQTVDSKGSAQRVIDITYTGQVDVGMGITSPAKLAEFCNWGVSPVVWIDDDTVLDTNDEMCHSEPILARMLGGVNQRRDCYMVHQAYQTQQQHTFKRNMMEVEGVTLEEVI